MKIKGLFVIPLVAILIAMLSLSVVPGSATDTTVSDSYTHIEPTMPATSSLEEELEVMISNAFGEDLQGAGQALKGPSLLMESFLKSMRNILNSLIRIFEIGGGMLGGDALSNLGGGLFG